MTLQQKIDKLTWHNLVNKLKEILKEFFAQKYEKIVANLAITGETPSLIEFENTTGNVSIVRDGEGLFRITSNSLFTEGKTWLNISNRDYSVYTEFGQNSDSELFITAKYRGDDSNSDLIEGISIEIRVYK